MLTDDNKREEVMVFIAKAKWENLISPEQFQEVGASWLAMTVFVNILFCQY